MRLIQWISVTVLPVALAACNLPTGQEASPSSGATAQTASANVNASAVCTVTQATGGVTIACGETHAFLANGSAGSSGALGAPGPTGPPSSPVLVLRNGDGLIVGTFLMPVGDSTYRVWDDSAGGFMSYNQHNGRGAGLLAGSLYLRYLTNDCSGPAYVPTAAAGGNNWPVNMIFTVGSTFYKVVQSEPTITLAGGSGTYTSYDQFSGGGNLTTFHCVPSTLGTSEGGTYSVAVPITTALPLNLTLPAGIERQ